MNAPDIIRQNGRSSEECEVELSLLVGDVIYRGSDAPRT